MNASRSTSMTANDRAVTGTHTENGRPRGHSSLTPHLVVSPAGPAIAFYREVFGAKVVDETRFGELVAHATLALPVGCFTLSDPLLCVRAGDGFVVERGSIHPQLHADA